jgi:hypothetical protein
MRRVVLALFLSSVAAVTHAAAPTSVEQTVERCKSAPDVCKTLIRAASVRAINSRQACIPKTVSPDEITGRVMQAVEDVLEEEPGLGEFEYDELAGQLIRFIWPCTIVS